MGMGTLRIDRGRVRRLFAAAGHTGTDRWDDRTIHRMLETACPLPGHFLEPADADYAEELYLAVAAGQRFEIGDANDIPAGGVIETIIALLQRATAANPLTREQLHEELCQRFPGRDRDSLMTTIRTNVPSRLRMRRYLDVRIGPGEGFWIETPGAD